jgi:YbbR domain-containing protein
LGDRPRRRKLKLGFLKHNLGLKFAALIVTLALWLYVKSLEEPMNMQVFNTPLIVASLPQDVQVIEMPDSVAGKMWIPFGEIDRIDLTNVMKRIRAYVDLENAEPGTNEYPIRLVVPPELRRFTAQLEESRVSITTEVVERRSFPVEVVPTGAPAAGLEFANASVDPQMVRIEAPSRYMQRIAKVRVLLNLGNSQSGDARELDVEVLDANDRPLGSKDITVVPERVRVTPAFAPAQPRRNLIISPVWTGQVPVGYRVVNATMSPSAVLVVGSSERLKGMSIIDTEPIDLSGLTRTTEIEVALKVPEGMKVQGRSRVKVRIEVVAVTPAPEPSGSTQP